MIHVARDIPAPGATPGLRVSLECDRCGAESTDLVTCDHGDLDVAAAWCLVMAGWRSGWYSDGTEHACGKCTINTNQESFK